MKRMMIVAMLLTLGGCVMTPTRWTNTDPSVSQEQFERDKAACMAQSDAGTASSDNVFAPLYGYQVIFPECMRSRGYIAQH